MSATAKLLGYNTEGGQARLQVIVTLAGNYPAGGDPLDLTPLIGQAGNNGYPFAQNNPPKATDASASSAYTASFIPGTTLANGKLKFIDMNTHAELAAGAYPGALTGDTNIQVEAVFDKLL